MDAKTYTMTAIQSNYYLPWGRIIRGWFWKPKDIWIFGGHMLFVAVESLHVSFLTTLLGCFLKKAEVFTITSLLLREYNSDSLLRSLDCA